MFEKLFVFALDLIDLSFSSLNPLPFLEIISPRPKGLAELRRLADALRSAYLDLRPRLKEHFVHQANDQQVFGLQRVAGSDKHGSMHHQAAHQSAFPEHAQAYRGGLQDFISAESPGLGGISKFCRPLRLR